MLVFWYPPPAGSTKSFLDNQTSQSPGAGGLALACKVANWSSMYVKDRKHKAVLWGARLLTKWVKSIWEHIFPDSYTSQKKDTFVEQTEQNEYWPSEFRK
jgi:hypothetical protein